jgi:tRNA threonylcarbamoyladenosine biosynthesis protein TsaB
VLDTERPDNAVHESKPMTRGHAEALMPLVARVLERARVEAEALDRIAVTIGPGSFTGLRVGIAAARGIALATGKPAIGLTTLAAFAAPLISADDTVPVVSAIDARHEHVYIQVFGPGGLTLVKPQLMHLRDAVRAALGGPPRLVGTAAESLARAWPADEKPPRPRARRRPSRYT